MVETFVHSANGVVLGLNARPPCQILQYAPAEEIGTSEAEYSGASFITYRAQVQAIYSND